MRLVAEARAYRVTPDVVDRIVEVFVARDLAGVEASLEEMADPVVALVEPLGVEAVQTVLPGREARELGLDDEVVVIAHQAIGVTSPSESPRNLVQQPHERLPVLVVHVDPPTLDPTRSDVVDARG
jgi:hypothetical protein